MSQELKAQAKKIEQTSTKKGDTTLAMLTPEEVVLLHQRGGAGVRDKKTGVLHLYQRDDSNDRDPAGDGGGDTGGGDTGGGENHGSSSAEDRAQQDDYAEAADALGGATTARDSLKATREHESGMGDRAQTIAMGLNTEEDIARRKQLAMDNGAHKEWSNPGSTLLHGLWGYLTGGIVGAGMQIAKTAKTELVGGMPSTANPQSNVQQRDGAGEGGGIGAPSMSGLASLAPPAQATAPTPTAVVDFFTSEARRKMGRQSTIMNPGVGSTVTVNKKLMGQ